MLVTLYGSMWWWRTLTVAVETSRTWCTHVTYWHQQVRLRVDAATALRTKETLVTHAMAASGTKGRNQSEG